MLVQKYPQDKTRWIAVAPFALIGVFAAGCQDGIEDRTKQVAANPQSFSATAYDERIPDLAPELATIDGVEDIKEIKLQLTGYRAYRFWLNQPISHRNPSGETFRQMVTLLYKGKLAPTVLNIPSRRERAGYLFDPLTEALGANQITFDARYNEAKDPLPTDLARWHSMDAVADVHDLVKKLRPVLLGSWISEGRGDGATLAIAHRRYHPFDTQATVAYSAVVHNGLEDDRYSAYLNNIGSKICRDKLFAYQKALLGKKHQIVKFLEEGGELRPITFDTYPGKELEGLERAVHFFAFNVWHFWGPELVETECESVPDSSASALDLMDFLPFMLTLMMSGDKANSLDLGLNLQRQRELGFARWEQEGLKDLYSFDVLDRTPHFLGRAPEPFDPTFSFDLQFWTSLAMDRTIMLNGALDPNSAAAFSLPKTRIGESYVFTVANAGKDVELKHLADRQKEVAIDAIARWTGAAWEPKSEEPTQPE